ncbi:MAG: hypothetical protein M1G31_09465 [Pseudanabaena sp. Salubria-1]|nr:hypothetical protein [Pseudanabaena sp. Salubria-1]
MALLLTLLYFVSTIWIFSYILSFLGLPDWDRRGFGVLGAVSGTLACLTALEAIKFLTGFSSPLLSQLLTMDLGRLEFAKRRTHLDPDCLVCGQQRNKRSPVPTTKKVTSQRIPSFSKLLVQTSSHY